MKKLFLVCLFSLSIFAFAKTPSLTIGGGVSYKLSPYSSNNADYVYNGLGFNIDYSYFVDNIGFVATYDCLFNVNNTFSKLTLNGVSMSTYFDNYASMDFAIGVGFRQNISKFLLIETLKPCLSIKHFGRDNNDFTYSNFQFGLRLGVEGMYLLTDHLYTKIGINCNLMWGNSLVTKKVPNLPDVVDKADFVFSFDLLPALSIGFCF